MSLIDRAEFLRARDEAAAYWKRRGEDAAAALFLAMHLETCKFGMDAHSRFAWARGGDLEVGLRFHLETGRYMSSFTRRADR